MSNAASIKSETRSGESAPAFPRCQFQFLQKGFVLHRQQQTSPSRMTGAFRPEKAETLQSKMVNTCPKPIEDCKVGAEDWPVQNFKLNKDSSVVEQIHQTAVNMPRHPTKARRTISITELLLIERLLVPTNAINYTKTIHQPRRIDLPAQKVKGKGKVSEQEKVTVAIVNIADHRPRTTSEMLLQFGTCMNSHLKAHGNPSK